MANQRNDSPYQLPYSDRMSEYIAPVPQQMRAYLSPYCDPGRDHGQVIVTQTPPERPAAMRNLFPENVEKKRPANALPLKVKPTTYSRDLLVSSKRKAEMTDTEANAKNFLAASVRQAIDLCNLKCMKDTQTYRKVKEMMLYYNPTLDDTRDFKLIKNAVQKHLKYKRRSIRKRNPGMVILCRCR